LCFRFIFSPSNVLIQGILFYCFELLLAYKAYETGERSIQAFTTNLISVISGTHQQAIAQAPAQREYGVTRYVLINQKTTTKSYCQL
jgi:hypothetical protein